MTAIATGDAVEVLAEEPFRVVRDPEWGFGRLDPVPTDALAGFYESRYRDLLGRSRRGPDLTRLLKAGNDAAIERAWLAATIHADVVDAIDEAPEEGRPKTVLDIGCGTGDLLQAMTAAGWEAHGTEPSPEISALGREAGLAIATSTAGAFLEGWRAASRPPFGAVTLLNVLEHVPDPIGLLSDIRGVLAPGGRLVIRVPNDFNPLQAAVLRAFGGDAWWVVAPDHISYFDHRSLRAVVERLGFEVLDQRADFPMEMFILTGDDYRAKPRVGAAVHHRRRALEMALDAATRRELGRAWARAGVGRNVFLVARWRG